MKRKKRAIASIGAIVAITTNRHCFVMMSTREDQCERKASLLWAKLAVGVCINDLKLCCVFFLSQNVMMFILLSFLYWHLELIVSIADVRPGPKAVRLAVRILSIRRLVLCTDRFVSYLWLIVADATRMSFCIIGRCPGS